MSGRTYPATILGYLASVLVLSMATPTMADEPPLGPHETLYLFISNSIPKPGLLSLAKDASALRTPLILRGLAGSSLQETLVQMHPVAEVAAIEVDPLLYDAYGVEAVPAVVLTCGARGQGPFAMVYGLAPSAALPKLRKQLSCGQ